MQPRSVNLLFVAAGALLVASVALDPSPELGVADAGALGAGLGSAIFGLLREFSPAEEQTAEVPATLAYLLLALVVGYALWFAVELL